MFDIKDYCTIVYTTEEGGLERNPSITGEISINKKKLEEDVDQFCEILKQLEKLIGPYTIKVNSKKSKTKKRKNKKNGKH